MPNNLAWAPTRYLFRTFPIEFMPSSGGTVRLLKQSGCQTVTRVIPVARSEGLSNCKNANDSTTSRGCDPQQGSF